MSISCEPTSQKSATTAVAERATDRARLVELEARILECERSLRLFKMERYQVQSRLAAYTYPVLTLPPEIVSEIFEYFLPTYPTRPAALSSVASPNPMLLCQICRAWRELALATPALWCAFTLRLNTARAVAEKPHYMELALARSGSHPLSLRLECNVVPRHNSPLPLSPFFHTLAPHRARLEHLSLCGSLESLSALHGPLPLLRTVSLASLYHVQTGGEPLTAAFRAAPLLRSAALSSYSDIYAGVLPWAQLTALTVDQIPLHGCHAVLARAPHLVHCRFTLRAWLPDVGLTFPAITLPHLASLALLSPTHGAPLPLIGLLTLPALRTLDATERVLEPDPVAALTALVARSDRAPHTVCIGDPVRPVERYRAALPGVRFRVGRGLVGMPGLGDGEDWEEGGGFRRYWQWEGEEGGGGQEGMGSEI